MAAFLEQFRTLETQAVAQLDVLKTRCRSCHRGAASGCNVALREAACVCAAHTSIG